MKYKNDKSIILLSSIILSLYSTISIFNLDTSAKGKIILEKNFYDYDVVKTDNIIYTDKFPNTIADSSSFIFPLEGVITSPFNDIDDRKTAHEGIDIAAETGTEVKSSINGIVTKAYYSQTYGWCIYVVNEKTETIYAHNSVLLSSVGDKVSQGDIIALSGNTGDSTGPHLHFEIRINGIPENPAELCK